MRELWTARRADGSYVCARQPDGNWPPGCRQEGRIAPADVSGLHRLALLIRERTGLNLSLLYDRWQQGLFVRGLLLTLTLIVTSIAGSLAIGAAGAWLVARRVPVLAPALLGLAAFVRMTPPLLLMYVLFFGVGYYVAIHTGWTLNAFLVAVVCLSAYAGASNLTAFLEAWRVLRRRDSRPERRRYLRSRLPSGHGCLRQHREGNRHGECDRRARPRLRVGGHRRGRG